MTSTHGWGFHADLVVEAYLKLPLLTQLKALVFVRERESFDFAATNGRQPCSATTSAAYWRPWQLEHSSTCLFSGNAGLPPQPHDALIKDAFRVEQVWLETLECTVCVAVPNFLARLAPRLPHTGRLCIWPPFCDGRAEHKA